MRSLPKFQLIILFVLLITGKTFAAEIALIHSYHIKYPWVQQYRDSFLREVNTNNIVEFEMDTKRKNATEYQKIADDAWSFIEENQPKIVVLADDNALKFLGPKVVAANIPLVFLGINANPRHYISLNQNVTGALERPLLKRSVLLLKELLPGLKNVKVLMDRKPTSYAILETSFDDKFKQTVAGIKVDITLEESFHDWKETVSQTKAKGYDALIIANYAALRNRFCENVSLDKVSHWTSSQSPLPVFAFWSYSIGDGKAIGGLTISGKEQGIEAAKKVNHFFLKGDLLSISTPKRGTLIFSQHELQRWNIVLPPNILNKSRILD
ncbi:ABC transporter substrate-binding protein [uncultured Shewanella sp.]|uniref:ABC transporter substrate-binding protein n=1 Tax=Shewanella atlantica TaxID=271099 RepID=UPI00260DED76|nr:ABC transporter substrate binding protein [uncultured Shewanella sp.]